VAASFGIAGAAGAGSLDELIMRTQTCLAVSKAGGKNRLAARTPEGEVVILHSL
jgi:PleD family two-component response regulator